MCWVNVERQEAFTQQFAAVHIGGVGAIHGASRQSFELLCPQFFGNQGSRAQRFDAVVSLNHRVRVELHVPLEHALDQPDRNAVIKVPYGIFDRDITGAHNHGQAADCLGNPAGLCVVLVGGDGRSFIPELLEKCRNFHECR